MIKSIKVQLRPNKKQNTKMFQYAGAARFAYNWALGREQENHKQGNKFLSDGELRKEFTQMKKLPEYEWLNHVSNNVTKQAIKDACNTYKRFFKGLCKYPKFKSKKYAVPSFYQDNVKIKFTDTHVIVEGFAESKKRNKQKLNAVRLCEKDRIPTDCKYRNPRVTFDGLHWWVSVGIECEAFPAVLQSDGVGIDMGVKDLAVCSDNNTYKNINKTQKVKKLEKKKRRLQRAVSRKYEKNKKGVSYCKTSNIIKSEKELLKVSRRLTNIRQNYTHQTTSEIVKRKPSFICMEDLNASRVVICVHEHVAKRNANVRFTVAGMMKNKHLSKAVQQQSLHEFRRQMEYKSKWKNIPVVIADRWFPSSKLCSCCGRIKKDLKLSDRIYKCECGNVIDRDYQASLNLRAYGENALQSVI